MITYSASFITFLKNSSNKIAKTLYKAYENNYPAYQLMLTTKEINYLSLRQDGNISYLPAEKELKYNADGQWSREGRQDGKPAKVIRKLFTKKALSIIKDRDFEGFSNAYKATVFKGVRFEIRRNYDIPSVYDMKRARGDSSLNDSCMNYHSNQLDIYKNCPHLRILILIDDEGNLCGRSLVWDLSDDIVLMDRIYVVSDFMFELFIRYAQENGWWHKSSYRSHCQKDLFVNDKGEEVRKRFIVRTETNFDSYPYIDTFTYGCNGILYNYESGCHTYEWTDGCRAGDVWDYIDGRRIDPEFIICITHGQKIGEKTHIRNTVSLNGEIWWKSDPGIIEVGGSICHMVDTVFSKFEKVRLLKVKSVWSDFHDSYISEANSIEIEGEIHHINSALTIQRA